MKSFERGLSILFAFDEEKKELSAEELSSAIGIPHTSIYRFIKTLRKTGLIEKNTCTGKYFLGQSIVKLSTLIQSSYNIIELSLPILTNITAITGETSVLTMLRNDYCVCELTKEPSNPLRLSPKLGDPIPLYVDSTSQAILAFMPSRDQKNILKGELVQYGPKGITDKEVMKNRLHMIKKQGYVVTEEEMYADTKGISAPFFNSLGQVVGSLSVSGPKNRIIKEKEPDFIRLIMDSAQELTDQLKKYSL